MSDILLPFFSGLALAGILTPVVIRLAHRFGWVAQPRSDRWHGRPTALMGGIAIYGAAVPVWILFGGGAWWVVPLLLPATLLFALGVVDDRIGLRPHTKLIGQVIAAAIVPAQWIVFEQLPVSVALPLTFLWLVGITNAVNLLDNMDGLAAGIGLVAAFTLGLYSLIEGRPLVAPVAFGLAGACLGFLIFNFSPARIFMGDCGSMFLGFSLGTLGLLSTHRGAPNVLLALLVPCAVLAIPLFDTTLVTVSRLVAGRSIALGGRDHSSHRLVALGFSERTTALVFYAISGLFAAFALLSTQVSLLLVGVLVAVSLVLLAAVGLFLGFLQVYPAQAASEIPSTQQPLEAQIFHKKQLVQVLLDLTLIPLAFVGAHLVRFDLELPLMHRAAVVDAFPVVVVAKLSALYLCGAYRGVWRYAGMADAIYAFAGSTLGSLAALALLVLLGRIAGLSRAALLADWVIFTSLVVMARCGHTLIREAVGVLARGAGRRVLILGLGHPAMSLIARLRDPLAESPARVVGIIDDDPRNHHRSVNGVPVLGGVSLLADAIDKREIDCCILGLEPLSPAANDMLRECRRQGVEVYLDLKTRASWPTDGPPEVRDAAAVPDRDHD